MKYHRKPTIKQITALQYRNQGMSWRKAMIKAGYSPNVASAPGQNLIHKKGTSLILDKMRNELQDAGLTGQYMANKFKEWLDAQKIDHSHTEPDKVVPDYDTQLKAYDKWEKVVGIQQENPGIKRKLTVEEYIEGTIKK